MCSVSSIHKRRMTAARQPATRQIEKLCYQMVTTVNLTKTV